MGISISNHVRIIIMRALEDLAECQGVTNTSDLDLAEIEDEIKQVMLDTAWVAPEDAQEAAEKLAEDFDNVEVGA